MKKIYKTLLFLISIFLSGNLFATTHTISVANFAFTPNSVNAVVGDTIIWMWVSGGHTTTSSTVPMGATQWDEPINSTTPVYLYVIAFPGTYQFHCNIHSSMQGTIVAIANGINAPDVKPIFNLNMISNNVYYINYTVSKQVLVNLSVFDLTGKLVMQITSEVKPAGTFSEVFTFEELQKGIYLVEFIAGNQRITKRMIVE